MTFTHAFVEDGNRTDGPITGVIADRASVEWALGYGSVISLLAVAGASVYWLATAPRGAEKAIAR